MEELNDLDELLISHDELHIICKVLMGVLLEHELEDELENKLSSAKVTPGFAIRAQELEEKYSRRRRILMATGRMQ